MPGSPIEHLVTRTLLVRYVLRPHWRALVLAFAAMLISAAASLLQPWPLKVVLDSVAGSTPLPPWLATLVVSKLGVGKLALIHSAALAVVVIALVQGSATYIESYLTNNVDQHIQRDLRRDLYHHLHRLSLAYYDRQQTGALVSTLTNDVEAVGEFVATTLLGSLVNVLSLVGMLATMLYLDWAFTLVAISVTPALFLPCPILPPDQDDAARGTSARE
jgi:ABC-type multidrug transport system fused ATPase/permease subunit